MSVSGVLARIVVAVPLTAALALTPLLAGPCRAASPDAPIKAAIILNIIRFVDFGTSDRAEPLLLCVSRTSDAARAMAALNGERVGARLVVHRSTNLSDTSGCDVLYLGGGGTTAIPRLRHFGVLIIADGADVLDAGGTIGLVGSGTRIRFEANTRAAREAGIRLSSKLLRLAARVR